MSKTNQVTDEAIERVKNNNPTDYSMILSFAEPWVMMQFKRFTSEDLKADYYKAGNEPPVQPNVFGAVFRKLSKDGAIYMVGSTTAKNLIAHSTLIRVWISREYRLKQQGNRSSHKAQIPMEL